MRASVGRSAAAAIAALAVIVAGLSLVFFAWFLWTGFSAFPRREWDDGQRLALDFLLSLFFFLQHSGMVRRGVRTSLSRWVPEPLYGAVYAIGSGAALLVTTLLWQRTAAVLLTLEGAWRIIPLITASLGVAIFAWAAKAVPQFDIFGVRAARGWIRGSADEPEDLSVRGPYALIRHPFYSASILILWSTTELTADRLLLGVLWTAWIVAAARLEERDLIARFGESYLQYRGRVPMLVPHPW